MSAKTEISVARRKREAGVSLLELLCVLVVLGILVAIAMAGFSRSKIQFQRQSLATQLKTSFERARFDSTKRRASTTTGFSRVEIGTNYFRLRTDLDMDGTVENNEAHTFNFDPNLTGRVVDNLDFPVTVSFDRFGHATAKDNDGDPVDRVFRICDKNCRTLTSANSTVVAISETGTVAILPGGSTYPQPANPTWVTAQGNQSAGVNQTLRAQTNSNSY